jgi:CO/xanthine dehydrogenase FAD-binding subunit
VRLDSAGGCRLVAVQEFFTGPKRSVLAPDELIAAVHVPVSAGPQRFAKVGTRNSMVIAVCSFALALDVDRRHAGTGIGSAAPTPLRAGHAETYLAEALRWPSGGCPAALDGAVAAEFGRLVSEAASPIDDVRGSAAYRRHALSVLAARAIMWCWKEIAG